MNHAPWPVMQWMREVTPRMTSNLSKSADKSQATVDYLCMPTRPKLPVQGVHPIMTSNPLSKLFGPIITAICCQNSPMHKELLTDEAYVSIAVFPEPTTTIGLSLSGENCINALAAGVSTSVGTCAISM